MEYIESIGSTPKIKKKNAQIMFFTDKKSIRPRELKFWLPESFGPT
jgi:hypothetical protein